MALFHYTSLIGVLELNNGHNTFVLALKQHAVAACCVNIRLGVCACIENNAQEHKTNLSHVLMYSM